MLDFQIREIESVAPTEAEETTCRSSASVSSTRTGSGAPAKPR